jgi:hypothetical protein
MRPPLYVTLYLLLGSGKSQVLILYISKDLIILFISDILTLSLAFLLYQENAMNDIDQSIASIVITTTNSIRVKAQIFFQITFFDFIKKEG